MSKPERNFLTELRAQLNESTVDPISAKSGPINGQKTSDSGYRTCNSSNDQISCQENLVDKNKVYTDLASRLLDANNTSDYSSEIDKFEEETLKEYPILQRIFINYTLLPLTEDNFIGSRTKEIISRLDQYIERYGNIIMFYIVLLEIHRQREDRNQFKETVIKLNTKFGLYKCSQVVQNLEKRWFAKTAIFGFSAGVDVMEIKWWLSLFENIQQTDRKSIYSSLSGKLKPRRITQAELCSIEDSPELARRGAKKRPLNSDSSNIEINSKPIDFPPQKSEVKISESKVRFERDENQSLATPVVTPIIQPQTPILQQKCSEKFKTPINTFKKEDKKEAKPDHSVQVNGSEYSIIGKLGQGGFSKVYKCADQKNKMCALKYVDLTKVDKSNLEGIRNEIKHLENLKGKPNIIQLFNYELTDRRLFIVLEFGELDLQQYLSENKTMDTPTLKSYWRQMVAAVEIVHDCGIIHRDLKPCNFLIVRGVVKLIDFGIAHSISSDVTSLATDMVGTLNYMSPEQLLETEEGSRSVKVGKWADTWSLGCILYLMAYRRLPFQHFKSTHMKISKITDPKHEIEFPPHTCPNSLLLIQMLKLCLRRAPKTRPLPSEILNGFFYSDDKADTVCAMLKYLPDEEMQRVYKQVQRLTS